MEHFKDSWTGKKKKKIEKNAFEIYYGMLFSLLTFRNMKTLSARYMAIYIYIFLILINRKNRIFGQFLLISKSVFLKLLFIRCHSKEMAEPREGPSPLLWAMINSIPDWYI